MKHQELKWKARDGLDIFGQVWEPDVIKPKAVVCLVHGLGEHSSRYGHVAEALGREGFGMVSFDLRGHGRSGGARGHAPSVDAVMQDMDLLLERGKKEFPGLPLFLYGHSLGANLVSYYCLKFKPNIKGVVATSLALHTALEEQKLKIGIIRLMGGLAPAVTLSSGLDPNNLSRDHKVVQAYIHDPLVHDKASLGFGKIMLDVNQWTLRHAADFPLPLLLLCGKKDVLAFPSSSTEFAAPLKDKSTLVLWDEGYHELHNEPEQAEVFKTMTLWMDARLRD